MTALRVLMFAAALCITATIAAADQGPNAGRGSRRPVLRSHPERTIAQNIARDPKIEARVKEMLPPGTTLEEASDGFRNQGQFVAALQASKNLDIDFADLKAEMTGNRRLTLGEAIQKLKP